MDKGTIDRRFLNEFFLQLVSAYARKKAKEEAEKKPKERKGKAREERLERLPFIRPLVIQPVYEKPKLLLPQLPVTMEAPPPAPLTPLVGYKEAKPIETAERGKLDLGKIEQIMADPTTISIECDGPDKKIKIIKDSQISTAESLTSKEIRSVIETISKKTKVPIRVIFRAIFNGIVIDAIISDIIGPRFIITKEIK